MAASCDFDAIPRSVISGGSVRFFPRTTGFTKPIVSHSQTIVLAISQYPPEQSDTYVKATTKLSASAWPYYATDPTKSVVGGSYQTQWISAYPPSTNTNQRFHIDLGSAKVIVKIYYENAHNVGGETDVGAKTFTVWGTNTAGSFSELAYGTDTGWTQITASQATFDQHTASNVADPKYITLTNTTAYRYYAIKIADNWGFAYYMGIRRIELQTTASYTTIAPGYLWAFGDTHTFTIDGSTTDFLLADADDYFAVGDRVVLTTTDTLPTGLFSTVCYWVKTATSTALTLSLTSGGDAVAYTPSTGAGTQSVQHGSDQATPVHAYPTVAAPTVYDVTLTVTDAGTGTATKTHTDFIRSDAV